MADMSPPESWDADGCTAPRLPPTIAVPSTPPSSRIATAEDEAVANMESFLERSQRSNAESDNLLLLTPSVAVPSAVPVVRVSGYEILGELGRGGMGVVYKARHLKLKRLVALKMILSADHASPNELERFRREGEAVARLQHPNIVQIHEVGEQDGRPFFSLEWLAGGSLQQKLAGDPLPPCAGSQLVETLARAMHAAHQRGIIHRDLKPGNVLLTDDGTPKIGDFGLAKQLEGDSAQTGTGQIIGTPSYMAPEQALGLTSAVGFATDTYALGAILYETLTGRPPFKTDSILTTLHQVRTQEPLPPTRLNPTVPRDLETICLKCLQKDARKRYESALALADDLQRFREGRPITARPVGHGERLWRWCRRNPVAAAFILSLCLGTLVAAQLTVWALGQRDRANTKAAEAADQTEKAQRLAQSEAEQRGRAENALVHTVLSRVRENSVSAPMGWTWRALNDLETVRQLRAGDVDRAELRSLLADSLGRADLREAGVVAEGLDAGALAFSKDGRLLAVGEKKNGLACSVQIYEAATRQRIATRSFVSVGNSLEKLVRGVGKYQDGISCLAFSPNGRWLVAGTRHGRLCRWDTTAPSSEGVLWEAHREQDGVGALVFSPDGRQLISGSWDKAMRWNVADDWKGSVLLSGAVHDAGYSQDGSVTALAGEGGLRLFVGNELNPRKAILGQVIGTGLAVSPGGRLLAMRAGADIHLVDVQNGQPSRVLRISDLGSDRPTYRNMALSADGALLVAASGDCRVRLWDVASGRNFAQITVADREEPIPALSPDGRYLAVAADRRTLLYELRPNDLCATIAQHPYPIKAIDFSPDSRSLLCTSERMLQDRVVDSEVTVWDVASRKCTRTSKVLAIPGDGARFVPLSGGIAIHPDGNLAAEVSSILGVHLVPLRGAQFGSPVLETPGIEGVIALADNAIQFSGKGVQIREDPGASQKRAIRIPGNEVETGIRIRIPDQCRKSMSEGWSVMAAVRVERHGSTGPAFAKSKFTPTGRLSKGDRDLLSIPDAEYHLHLLEIVGKLEAKDVEWVDIALNVAETTSAVEAIWVDRVFLVPFKIEKWAFSLKLPRQGSLRFAPDGRRLWGVVQDDFVVSWRFPELTLATQWSDVIGEKLFGYKRVNCLAAGSKWVLVGTEVGAILLSASTGERLGSWPTPSSARSMALNPTETLAAVGMQKGHVRILAVPSGAVVAALPPHAQSVESIVFSGDGRLLLTGSADQTVRLWQKHGTGFELLVTLKSQSGRITSVRMSPDGTKLAILTEGNRGIHFWDLDRLKYRLDELDAGW